MIILSIFVFILLVLCVRLNSKVKAHQLQINQFESNKAKSDTDFKLLALHVKELTIQHNNLVSALNLEERPSSILPYTGPIGRA
jgi:hypothetical protein